jgi:hypothetical protein
VIANVLADLWLIFSLSLLAFVGISIAHHRICEALRRHQARALTRRDFQSTAAYEQARIATIREGRWLS